MKLTDRLSASLLFEPRDAWIGLYWERYLTQYSFYLCLLPFFPIRFRWHTYLPRSVRNVQ